MKLVTAAQMRRIDEITINERGIPGPVLMDRAGRAVARVALERFEPESVAVVTGKGNNAGDGFVVARELHGHGVACRLFMLKSPDELAGDALDAYRNMPEEIERNVEPTAADLREQLIQFDLVVDAIFGTGLSGPVRGPAADAIEAINACRTNVLSVDIPSGLPAERIGEEDLGAHIHATMTVTIGLPKIGMMVDPGVRSTGAVIVEDIGFPDDLLNDPAIAANLLTLPEARELLPPRRPAGHKGTFGRVMILGGSEGMTGAAVLAAQSAARSGAGLVYSCYPRPLGDIMESHLLEPVKLPLQGADRWFVDAHAPGALEHAAQMNAVAIGPGLGRRPETESFLRAIVREVKAPLVIDADGLRLLVNHLDDLTQRPGPTVLTPHPGEASSLLNCSTEEVEANRLDAFLDLCRDYGTIVALKGPQTVVTNPMGQITLNPTGNSGLAKGGSGDVLTGLIAGLLAQGSPALDAARLGVFLHGLAADHLAAETSVRAIVPGDLIERLGSAFARLEKPDHLEP